jgi:hypothetical protein
MLRHLGVSLSVLGLLAITLAGCSRYQKEQRAEWRSAAEKSCLRSGVVKETAHVKIAKSLEGPGTCGADHPIKVMAFTTQSPGITAGIPALFSSNRGGMLTKLNNEATFTCPMYSAVDRWRRLFNQPPWRGSGSPSLNCVPWGAIPAAP